MTAPICAFFEHMRDKILTPLILPDNKIDSSIISGGLVYDNIMRYQIAALFESPMFWLATLTTIVAAVLPDILLHVYDQMIYYRTVNSVVQHR